MRRINNFITARNGPALQGARVEAVNVGTLALLPMYSLNDPIPANLITHVLTDAEGKFGFYVTNARITLKITYGGVVQYVFDELIFDPNDVGIDLDIPLTPGNMQTYFDEGEPDPGLGAVNDEYTDTLTQRKWKREAGPGWVEQLHGMALPTYADHQKLGELFDPYNGPEKYRQVANAIKRGTCKVVFVGDSFTWGADTNAPNGWTQRIARNLRAMYPSCAFTFLNRGIPGATMGEFNDAGFTPAAAPFLTGPDNVTPATVNDVQDRWTDGVETHAIAWKTVVQNDQPDLVIIGFGYNDINRDNISVNRMRLRWLGASATLNGIVSKPSIVLMAEHPGRLGTPASPTTNNHQAARGVAQLFRGIAAVTQVGLLDMARGYDLVSTGVDPLKTVIKAERWFANWPDSDYWSYQVTTNGATADTITDPGDDTAVLDSAGLHAGAGESLYIRKFQTVGCQFRFNIRRLATGNDIFWVWLGMDDVAALANANDVGNERQLRLAFYNAGGSATLLLMSDEDIVANVATLPPIPTDDSADYFVTVEFHRQRVRVWVKDDPLSGAPRIDVSPVTHGPSYIGFGYKNAVAAPSVKVKNFEMRLEYEAPETKGVHGITDTVIFGRETYTGPGLYEEAATPVGGDGQAHMSDIGYALLFEPAIWSMIRGISLAVDGYAPIAAPNVMTGVAYTVTAGDEGRLIHCTNAAAITITLPTQAQQNLKSGFRGRIQQGGDGVVTLAPGAGDNLVNDGGLFTVKTPNKYATLIYELIGTGGGVNTWAVYTVEKAARARNIQTDNYTIQESDRDRTVYMDHATAKTVTLPTPVAVPLFLGTRFRVQQGGVGVTTIAPGAGDALVSDTGSFKLRNRYATVEIELVGFVAGAYAWALRHGTQKPACRAQLITANQNIAVGAVTPIVLNSLAVLRGETSDWTLNGDGSIQANRDIGLCSVSAGIYWSNAVSTGTNRQMFISQTRAGVDVLQAAQTCPDLTGATKPMNAACLIDILAGDKIYLKAYHNSATTPQVVLANAAAYIITKLEIAAIG